MSTAGNFNVGAAGQGYAQPGTSQGVQSSSSQSGSSQGASSEGAGGEGTLREMGDRIRETAEDTLRRVQEAAPEYYEQGREKLSEMTAGIEDYIRREPMKATLIAAGIGLCLGLCLTRR